VQFVQVDHTGVAAVVPMLTFTVAVVGKASVTVNDTPVITEGFASFKV